MYPRGLLGPARRSGTLQGGRKVRSTRLAAVALAMMLVSAGCGARLTSKQLAQVAASGGQRVSAGAAESGESGAATDTGSAGGSSGRTAGGSRGAPGGSTGGEAAAGAN